jgi:hypothetical protein
LNFGANERAKLMADSRHGKCINGHSSKYTVCKRTRVS